MCRFKTALYILNGSHALTCGSKEEVIRIWHLNGSNLMATQRYHMWALCRGVEGAAAKPAKERMRRHFLRAYDGCTTSGGSTARPAAHGYNVCQSEVICWQQGQVQRLA